jgi:hypothetical protein
VGFDISCGVRLLAAEVGADELRPTVFVEVQVIDSIGGDGGWRPGTGRDQENLEGQS